MRERTFQVDDELTLHLRPVSLFKMRAIAAEWNKKKPMPPPIQVEIGNGRFATDYNEKDKNYLHCLEIWETEASDANIKYVVLAGVSDNPPQSFIDDHRAMFPDETMEDIRLYWLTSIPPDKFSELANLLMGQTNVTQEGLKEAAATFQGEGERDRRTGLETPAAESGQGE